MKTIKSIDLWTEQYENHYECFNGIGEGLFRHRGLKKCEIKEYEL